MDVLLLTAITVLISFVHIFIVRFSLLGNEPF